MEESPETGEWKMYGEAGAFILASVVTLDGQESRQTKGKRVIFEDVQPHL
jgi:hypothetical protein